MLFSKGDFKKLLRTGSLKNEDTDLNPSPLKDTTGDQNAEQGTIHEEFVSQLRFYLEPYQGETIDREGIMSVLAGLLIQYPEILSMLGSQGFIALVKNELKQAEIDFVPDLAWDALLAK
ncbi:hypothetical protein [Sphingobacterium sp. BN32]|uniref:hypothetical protein n=1 Tax=Sphingobacterium sp. BN32 TaxID=3058432 RepID=UPI00265C9D9A|nr:hypothetical protein [Sphingobacterium sp. BN32]WKK58367.1 hypothetical protein QYC40_17205 [Sphingobacterium sp. BN32]